MRYEVPIWEKANLTFEEAAAYFGIGINKLRDLTSNDYCPYVWWIGSKRLIKRRAFERYLETAFSVCFYILLWKMEPGYDKITLSIQTLSTAERSLTMSAKRKEKKGRVLRTGESQRKDLTYIPLHSSQREAAYGQCRNGNQGPAISDGTLGCRCDMECLYPCFLCPCRRYYSSRQMERRKSLAEVTPNLHQLAVER